jgi:hypothetical protein
VKGDRVANARAERHNHVVRLNGSKRDKIMTRVIVDDALRSKLHNLTEPLELCDSLGNVVGRFVPAFDPSEYEQWEPEFSEEELLQEEQSNEKRYTTAEVLAHLKSLESR